MTSKNYLIAILFFFSVSSKPTFAVIQKQTDNVSKLSPTIISEPGIANNALTINYRLGKILHEKSGSLLPDSKPEDQSNDLSIFDFLLDLSLNDKVTFRTDIPLYNYTKMNKTFADIGNPYLGFLYSIENKTQSNPTTINFELATILPRKTNKDIQFYTQDVVLGLGFSKQLPIARFSVGGKYVVKLNKQPEFEKHSNQIIGYFGSTFFIDDSLWLRLISKYTQSGTFHQSEREDTPGANIIVLEPSFIYHMSDFMDLTGGVTIPINEKDFQGKEESFGDLTIAGLYGIVVQVGMNMRF